jgi:hypothetical protein
MTDRRPNRARVAAQALFKTITPEQKASATAEYNARQRMADQKAARLAWYEQRLMFGSPTPVFRAPTTSSTSAARKVCGSPPGDDGK